MIVNCWNTCVRYGCWECHNTTPGLETKKYDNNKMKHHSPTLVATVLLHLIMESRSQVPQQPMSAMGMPGMPMASMGMPAMPMPMGIPMPMMPQQRMPVVVMPYHSKSADSFIRRKKRKRLRRIPESESTSSSESDSRSTSSSSSDEVDFRSSTRSKRKRHQVLTPVVSYVTKDGYVVYQKKIKKDRAKDWLDMGKASKSEAPAAKSGEMTLRQLKKKYGNKKKRHHRDRRGS